METILCVSADRPHGSRVFAFLKLGPRVDKKTAFSSSYVCIQRAGWSTPFFSVENHHSVALNIYYSVSTAICVFAVSPSLQRYSWNALKENRGIVFACVDGASVRLHTQLNPIKAIVRQCSSIEQLQLSEYTWRWESWFIGRSMSCPGTMGGSVPIATSNRATGWPLYVTTQAPTNSGGIRERCFQ